MPKGPQEARLDRAVAGSSRAVIQAAEEEWRNGARALETVAMALDVAGPEVIAKFGGTHTGPAAQQAFRRVAEKVRARRAQMEQAASALGNADVALGEARKVHASLGALPAEPARPDITPGTNDVDAVRQQRAYSTQLGSYHAAMADREAKAEAAANEMDRVYRDSTATMERVHGEPDARSGGSGSPGGSGGGAVGAAAGSSGGGAVTTTPVTTSAPPTGHHTAGPSTAGATHVVAPPGATPAVLTMPGTAQDGTVLPPAATPTVLGASGAPVSSSPGGSAAGGLVGALGGGLLGGAAGIGGAVRGGMPVSGTAAAAAGRSIGSSARTAAAGTLGRSGATATSGSTASTSRTGTTSPAARSGATGATSRAVAAMGSAGRAGGRGVAGPAGAAGTPGSRSGPRGAGMAAARGGRVRDEDPNGRDDLFESPQDWVEDEDAAPGVID